MVWQVQSRQQKEWLRKKVTAHRLDSELDLEEFTDTLNKFVEDKGLGTQYMTFTVPSKKPDTPINAISAKGKKEIEE